MEVGDLVDVGRVSIILRRIGWAVDAVYIVFVRLETVGLVVFVFTVMRTKRTGVTTGGFIPTRTVTEVDCSTSQCLDEVAHQESEIEPTNNDVSSGITSSWATGHPVLGPSSKTHTRYQMSGDSNNAIKEIPARIGLAGHEGIKSLTYIQECVLLDWGAM